MTSNCVHQQSRRQRVHQLLEHATGEDPLGLIVDYSIVTLVLANVLAFLLGTVPWIEKKYGGALEVFEIFSVAIFTVEYFLRIWAAAEFPLARGDSDWKTRLKFAVRPLPLIDLLAIAPFYLSFLFVMDLRVLRILRLFRLLKLARYSPSMQALVAVLNNERRALFGALLLMICLLLFASTGIYFLEHKAQPEVFGSVPAAMWWAIATLTTVGYGDVVPVTTPGKIFGAIIMLFGLGMFALPIGIIATGFSQESSRREFVVSMSLVANVPMFSKLEASEIALLLPALNSSTYTPGELILHAGDIAEAMYFIASGRVEVETSRGPVFLSEGEHFGEAALMEHRARSRTVRADTKCRVLILAARDFYRLIAGRPELLELIRETAKARIFADQKSGKG